MILLKLDIINHRPTTLYVLVMFCCCCCFCTNFWLINPRYYNSKDTIHFIGYSSRTGGRNFQVGERKGRS